MTLALAWTITVAAAVLALLGFATTIAGRRFGTLHLAGSVLLEAVLLVQAVVAVVALAGGHELAETATFWGYLIGVVLVPVLAALWAWTEPSRWAGTQVAVGAVAVAIMTWRLYQLWEGIGG